MGTTVSEPTPRHWTRDEYYRVADLGLFQGQRVEFLEGEIIEMPAQKNPHVMGVTLAHHAMLGCFGAGFWVRTQAPLNLPDGSAPEPDVAVVQGDMHSYSDHPTTALLVIEVSDTTLDYDRIRKSRVYALAGITDYWIINLVDRWVEVFRNPVTVSGPGRASARYGDGRIVKPGDSIAPLATPGKVIAVSDLPP